MYLGDDFYFLMLLDGEVSVTFSSALDCFAFGKDELRLLGASGDMRIVLSGDLRLLILDSLKSNFPGVLTKS